jgi:hypothetical protein
MMRLSLSVVVLAVLLFPSLLQAEVWRCPQETGTDLFTNLPRESEQCETYVPSREVIPVPLPALPPVEESRQASPTILMPFAQNGPTPPEYDVPYSPDYYYSYPYSYSPFYGGFFFLPRPHFRHAPRMRPHFGVPGIRPHFGVPGMRPHFRAPGSKPHFGRPGGSFRRR